MSHSHLENTIFQLLCQSSPLRTAHLRRLALVCCAVLLAGATQMSLIARRIAKPISQPGRVLFLQRFLQSPLFTQEVTYQPLVRQALHGYQAPVWHLVIDRSPLVAHRWDLLMVSLSIRKRAIPLAWQVLRFGATPAQTQIRLLSQVESLIPVTQAVVVHGDTEFGAVPMMQFVRQHPHWDFVFGQSKHTYYHLGDWQWRYLGDLKVTRRQPPYRAHIFWTKGHVYGPLNLFAFYQPRLIDRREPLYEIGYCTTSLPITHTLRRLGRRRWGIEPMFRDFKSSGWHLDHSALRPADTRQNLLLLLAINYLWATCTGRWLCKSGRRREIDGKKSDITLYFVLVGIGLSINMNWINPFQPV